MSFYLTSWVLHLTHTLRIPFCLCLTGRQRLAHRPNSKPKLETILDLKEEDEENQEESSDEGSRKGIVTEEELWARLDELEKLEELEDEQDRYRIVFLWIFLSNFNLVRNWNVSWISLFFRLSDNADMNSEDTSSSSSSEEEKEGDAAPPPVNGLSLKPSWTPLPQSAAPPNVERKQEEDDDEEEGSCLPTIFFTHTVEPKKVRAMRLCTFWSSLLILPFYFCFGDFVSFGFRWGSTQERTPHWSSVRGRSRRSRPRGKRKTDTAMDSPITSFTKSPHQQTSTGKHNPLVLMSKSNLSSIALSRCKAQ